ncbi:MAG: ABC transporter permease, partial [Deltaproteobacteria bacterium]|nr:ABC transporter permease [Deltaproteobacteria bacterium]
LIWGIPFLVQPISAIFYPLSVLPPPVQVVSRLLPSTYVFEGMRAVIRDGTMPFHDILIAFGLNLVYFLLAGLFFKWMYAKSRDSGRLGRLGMD